MNKLTSVIGLAPSEKKFFQVIEALTLERERIRKTLNSWGQAARVKASKPSKAPKASKGLKLKDMKLIAQKLDITLEELNEIYSKKEV